MQLNLSINCCKQDCFCCKLNKVKMKVHYPWIEPHLLLLNWYLVFTSLYDIGVVQFLKINSTCSGFCGFRKGGAVRKSRFRLYLFECCFFAEILRKKLHKSRYVKFERKRVIVQKELFEIVTETNNVAIYNRWKNPLLHHLVLKQRDFLLLFS